MTVEKLREHCDAHTLFVCQLLYPLSCRSRLHTHSNFEKVKEFLPESILPQEYGGEVPMSEMIEDWKKELEQKRDQIQSLDSIKFYTSRGECDETLKKSAKSSQQCHEIYVEE